jgi:hypothetical protein
LPHRPQHLMPECQHQVLGSECRTRQNGTSKGIDGWCALLHLGNDARSASSSRHDEGERRERAVAFRVCGRRLCLVVLAGPTRLSTLGVAWKGTLCFVLEVLSRTVGGARLECEAKRCCCDYSCDVGGSSWAGMLWARVGRAGRREWLEKRREGRWTRA